MVFLYLYDFIRFLSTPHRRRGLITSKQKWALLMDLAQAPRITWLALNSTLTASPATSANSVTASLVITA